MARATGLEHLRGRRPWTEEQARRVLEAQRQSGEPVSTFAARAGFSAQRIYWWRARLKSQPEIAPATQLVPVAVRLPVDDLTTTAATVDVLDQHLRIEVRVLDTGSARWIVEVLRHLRERA